VDEGGKYQEKLGDGYKEIVCEITINITSAINSWQYIHGGNWVKSVTSSYID